MSSWSYIQIRSIAKLQLHMYERSFCKKKKVLSFDQMWRIDTLDFQIYF